MDIILANVTVQFSRWGSTTNALSDVSLVIPTDTLVWVHGPNGSGKSTLLGAICGEVRVSEGEIRVGGCVVDANSPPYDKVFLVPQNPMQGTVGTLSVLEHLLIADEQRGLTRTESIKVASKLLTDFALDLNLDQRVDSLSGGQRQILGLLLALRRQARVILLDEPTSALDPSRRLIAEKIVRAMRTEQKTVIVVSHNEYIDSQEEMMKIVVSEGHITKSGPNVGNSPTSESSVTRVS